MSTGFASLLLQAAQRSPHFGSSHTFHFLWLSWLLSILQPFPGSGLSSIRAPAPCHYSPVAFHSIRCPESVDISYKPARFACMIVLLSRWMSSSGYLVLIWFSYCFVCTQGKRFCIKILLDCWVTWTLLLCHVLNCLSMGPGYVISCKMCFLFPHWSFAWMASKLSTYWKLGKFSLITSFSS